MDAHEEEKADEHEEAKADERDCRDQAKVRDSKEVMEGEYDDRNGVRVYGMATELEREEAKVGKYYGSGRARVPSPFLVGHTALCSWVRDRAHAP